MTRGFSSVGDRATEYRALAATLEAPHDPTAPVTVVNPLAAVVAEHNVKAAALRGGGGQGRGSASPFAVNVAAPELVTSGRRSHGRRPSVELAASGRSWPPPARDHADVEAAKEAKEAKETEQVEQVEQQTRVLANTFDCENPLRGDTRRRSIALQVVRRMGSVTLEEV